MQVLSQLSYNPTDSVGPLVGADIGRHPARLVTGLLDGRVPRSSFAGFHRPGSLVNEVVARTAPASTRRAEDITGAPAALNAGARLDTSPIFTI